MASNPMAVVLNLVKKGFQKHVGEQNILFYEMEIPILRMGLAPSQQWPILTGETALPA